jgi:hypothetical protein
VSRLPRAFFDRPVVAAARDLVGCTLTHGATAGVIVETEAYHQSEPACHAHVGVTGRTHVLFRRPGTVYVYRGRGWRPNRSVEAEYGSYCPPRAEACATIVQTSRFRTDRRGRFTFRLRHGNLLLPRVPRPASAGGGADTILFVQWSGREGRSRRIERDAIPKPPPSTPTQRDEARVIAQSFARASRALDAAEWSVQRSAALYEQQLRQCRYHLSRFKPRSPHGYVVSSLIALAFEGSLLVPVKPHLDTLVADVERIELQDAALRAGRDAWVAALRRPRPWPDPDLCTVMERWSQTGFDLAQAPVDPDTGYRRLLLRIELTFAPAVAAAAARLRALGAGRAAEEAFAGGLLDAAELTGET